MRLCAALAVVLVASLVLAFEVMRRPRRHAPATPDVAEIAPPQAAPPRTPFRPPSRAAKHTTRPPLPAPPPASISGRLHVPDGADIVYVTVRPNGAAGAETSGFAHDSSFQIDGLVSGHRYDVEFSGPDVRTLKLIGVAAPAADLDVALEALAVIHVAVGFPRGAQCPIDTLLVRTRDGSLTVEEGGVAFNSECRFELEAPPMTGDVVVVAEGAGLALEATVTIPEHGDPAPICLNPPCRANPLEGLAQLHVMLEGADSRSPIDATIAPLDDSDARWGCASSLFTCHLDALPANRTYAITASGRACHGGPVLAALHEGENVVSVPCVRDPPASESPPDPPDDFDS